jgi:hypothetical protein
VQIHVGRHQEDLFPAHVGHLRAAEPAPGGRSIIHLSVCYFIVNIFMVLAAGA